MPTVTDSEFGTIDIIRYLPPAKQSIYLLYSNP